MCKVYIDGACNNDTREGAWAYIMLYDDFIIKKSGNKPFTTSNEMELKALEVALLDCKSAGIKELEIFSDSAYVVNGLLNGTVRKWKKNKWKNRKGKNIKHKELWKNILFILDGISVQIVKVEAHSGNYYNDMVDHLAKEAVRDNNVCSGKIS